MDYEIVKLEEKKVVGIAAKTNNRSPEMMGVIGGLWERFYGSGVYLGIQNKVSEKALGLYLDYAGDENDDYCVMTAYEVKSFDSQPEGTERRIIPGGTYAKFVVTGELHQSIAKFWEELWNMDLHRTFVCDFEEYQNGDSEHAEIHVYIGIEDENKE